MSNSHIKRKSLQNGVEILVRGIVQGVGFRPFVFKLAARFEISGTVTNTSDGVVIQAIARDERLFSFVDGITSDAPPLSRIIDLQVRPLDTPLQATSFTIIASQASRSSQAIIPPDIALCRDCEDELNDAKDRRYRYPFINCTNCGPRFSIVETIPYDRPKTSMSVFGMCQACSGEYRDPMDRRFHAQPNACPVCGPQISWHDSSGQAIDCPDVVQAATTVLAEGRIVAIRGMGGFHLCTDACSKKAVSRLRTRKNRPSKPLAIMVRDITAVKRYCHVSDEEGAVLMSIEHPIVLLQPREGLAFAAGIAPDMCDIGMMLPYTPLHHLLFKEENCPDALVMTSGNSSGEPICTSSADALNRLHGIADYFLLHNRDIITRVDDSVVKIIGGTTRLFRRSRGYVPSPVQVPYELPQVIGCGGGLKSTFSLSRGKTIFPSQHIGDLFNLSSYEFYTESAEKLKRLLQIEPVAACCDLHPDYLSSHYAKELSLPVYPIQHHHAHAVAVMAEHGLSKPVLSVILDGTGYGSDGTIWGGEILLADLVSFSRVGALEAMPLPGGDAAAEKPWRMAQSCLYQIQGPAAAGSELLGAVDQAHRNAVVQMIETNFNTPLTSSCGRLFDAVAALLGLSLVTTFEGQAAMQLESLARQALTSDWKDLLMRSLNDESSTFHRQKEQRWEIISSEFVKRVVYDSVSGKDRSTIALQFHSWLISSISRLVEKLSGTTGITDIVLSGGCMQNGLLLEGLSFTLSELGLTVYSGAQIPMNDGGISIGQTVIGGLRHVSRRTDES